VQIETLKVFCDVVESKSFSQAAIRNTITQSAVSQQVKNLEARFESQLLVRGGRSITPTEAGNILYQAAREILQRFDHFQSELKSLGRGITGTVRVATVHSVGLYEMTKVIKTFLKKYPRVNLHIDYNRATRVYENCLNGSIDLGIVPYPKPRKGIHIISLPADLLILICSPEHPFAHRHQVDIHELDAQNFVAFEKGIPSRQALDQIFRKHNIKVRVVTEFDNIETIKRSVEIGAGLSIVPLLSVQREVLAGALVQIPFVRHNFFRPLGIIVRRNHPMTPAVEKFIELLQRPQ